MSLPHVGDIGWSLEALITKNGVALDLSIGPVSTQEFIFKKPDGVFETFTTTFIDDGADGLVTFTTTADTDLDQESVWQVQFHFIRPGEDMKTQVGSFDVGPEFS